VTPTSPATILTRGLPTGVGDVGRVCESWRVKAVVCQNAELSLVERPEPAPRRGQVRLAVRRCVICGSDLHARHGLDEWAELAERAGYDRLGRSHEPVVFGHEFSGDVAEYGPGCKADVPTGASVVALPLIRGARGVDTIGMSVHAPGAYAEQLLVEESLSCRCRTAWVPTSPR
jgi:threonine dehydrogenase-like Zn-dependent dehydrogenase